MPGRLIGPIPEIHSRQDKSTYLRNATLEAQRRKKGTAHYDRKIDQLLNQKAEVERKLKADIKTLESMPDIDKVKREAEEIRQKLLKQFGSEEHLLKMSFDKKRRLLGCLFSGKDSDGKPYRIYASKTGSGKKIKLHFLLYGKLIAGEQTLKSGDKISWPGPRTRWTVPRDKFKTNSPAVDRPH